MGKVTVHEPEKYDEFEADDRGRISLGSEYAGKTVVVLVEKTTDKTE